MISFLFIQIGVNAQGITSNIASAKSLSLGGASGVYIKDASSSYFNPAVTSLLETNSATMGIGLISSNSSFLNPLYKNEPESSTSPLLLPFNAYGSYKIDYGMVASLAINTPFAFGKTWGDDWSGRYITQEIRMKTINFQPTFSYLIREDLAVGAGFILARSSFLYKHKLQFQDITSTFTANAFGFGFNIGVWGKISENTEYGVSFKSPINYDYSDGKAKLGNIPSLLSSKISDNEDVSSAFKTPYQLSISMSNQLKDHLFLTYQFDLDGWKVYQDLTFDYKNENLEDVSFLKNYRNSFAFRVGGEYVFSKEFQMRGGFYYKDSPIISDEYFSPDFPKSSGLGISSGFSYWANKELSIDFAINLENTSKKDVKNLQHNFEGVYRTYNYSTIIGVNYNF